MPPALVDLFCNNLEVGKSVTVSDVGPTSAYVEHESPLPVGAELRLHTDEGTDVGAVVVRVHEKVADATRQPGMFVRVVQIEGDAEAWWKKHIDHESDPVFPEGAIPGSSLPGNVASSRTHTVDMSAEEIARMALEDQTAASAAVPIPGPPPADDSAPNAVASGANHDDGASEGLAKKLHESSALPDAATADVNTTVKMTADQVKSITDQAPAEGRNGTSMGMAVAVPPPDVVAAGDAEPAPKKKRKRRKKKKS